MFVDQHLVDFRGNKCCLLRTLGTCPKNSPGTIVSEIYGSQKFFESFVELSHVVRKLQYSFYRCPNSNYCSAIVFYTSYERDVHKRRKVYLNGLPLICVGHHVRGAVHTITFDSLARRSIFYDFGQNLVSDEYDESDVC